MAHPRGRLHADRRASAPGCSCPAQTATAPTAACSASAASWAASSWTTRSRSTATREACRFSGFAGLPTLHRADAAQQFLFVNGRPVQRQAAASAPCAPPTPISFRAAATRCSRCSSTLAAARGRRQRAPGQGRGALPRPRPACAALHRQRARGGAARRRPPRLGRQAALASAAASCGRTSCRFERVRAPAIPAARRPAQPRFRASPRRCRRRFDGLAAPSADARAVAAPVARGHARPRRSAPPARSCTRTTSWRRRATASSSSTSTPRTSAWSTSA